VRVLLTGGGGFVGRHLRALLAGQGVDVTAPSSTSWDLRNASRTDQVVREVRPDRVLHLAARTSLVQADRDPVTVRDVNVAGTAHLLAALSQHAPSARLVFTSTCHVYGSPQALPVTESHPLRSVGAYARSKRDAELRVRAWSGDAVILRPFHLTGPGQPSTHAASDWARQAALGATSIRCGDLALKRDFIDVRDAVAGLWLAAQTAPSGAVMNLCSGSSVALAVVLAGVAPGVAPRLDPARLRAHDVLDLRGDPSALEGLGWMRRYRLPRTLRDLRTWWDAQL
jgi:GDP-4-dehydro-6-deoxy-D-mannose reductase